VKRIYLYSGKTGENHDKKKGGHSHETLGVELGKNSGRLTYLTKREMSKST